MAAKVPPPRRCKNSHKNVMYCTCADCTARWRAWAQTAVAPVVAWCNEVTQTSPNDTLNTEGIIPPKEQ